MTEEKKFTLKEAHNAFAPGIFNRAQALNGNAELSMKYVGFAKSSVDQIKKKGDKDYFLEVFEKEPWFSQSGG